MTWVSKLIRVSEGGRGGKESRVVVVEEQEEEEAAAAVTHSPVSVCNQAAEAVSSIRARLSPALAGIASSPKPHMDASAIRAHGNPHKL